MRAYVFIALLSLTLAGCADDASEDLQETDVEGTQAPVAGLLLNETFTGSLPAADTAVVIANHTVSVPANATRMEIQYDTTFTGAWSAVLTVFDPEGTERTSSLDACETPDPGAMAAFSCTLKIAKPAAGDWGLQLAWQVGEVTEDYILGASVWGYA